MSDIEKLKNLIKVLQHLVQKHIQDEGLDDRLKPYVVKFGEILTKGDDFGWTEKLYCDVGELSPWFDGLAHQGVEGAYEYYGIISNLTCLIRVESHGDAYCDESAEYVMEDIAYFYNEDGATRIDK